MRKMTLAAAALLLSATVARGQGRPGMGGGMGPQLDDATFRPTIATLTSMLGLTPAQVLQITPLRDSLLAATRTQRQDALAARAAMQEARRSGAGADSLRALRQRMQASMMAMMPARTRFHDQVRGLLTESQARIFDAHHQEMMGSMGQRMQGRQPGSP